MCCYSIKHIKCHKDDNAKHTVSLGWVVRFTYVVRKILPIRAIIPQVITQNKESY